MPPDLLWWLGILILMPTTIYVAFTLNHPIPPRIERRIAALTVLGILLIAWWYINSILT